MPHAQDHMAGAETKLACRLMSQVLLASKDAPADQLGTAKESRFPTRAQASISQSFPGLGSHQPLKNSGPVWSKAPGTVIWGHDTLKVTSFIVASGGGRVEADRQTGGARKLDSKAQDKGPTAGLPGQALVFANKSTTASLINLWNGV